MVISIKQRRNGSWSARKRIPRDVRDDYGATYGQFSEALFSAPSGMSASEVKRRSAEWSAEIDARIANIRAKRKGEGVSLTRQQVRGITGEWYDWFISRHPTDDVEKWEAIRDQVHEAVREEVGEERWERHPNPDDLWRRDPDLRKAIRPLLADLGETAQFLAVKRLTLDNETRDRFLDDLYEDLAAALNRLLRISQGDYSPDEYVKRFPKFTGADTGETPWQLFERWAGEKKPSPSTIESWRPVFRAMGEHFKERSAASITTDEAQQWIRSLVTGGRSAQTVRKTWITASKTVFGWAATNKLLRTNPFKEVTVTVPRKVRLRETQAFMPEEWRIILKAALAVRDTSKSFEAAKRWVPWLCAYTGARPGEITQLRKSDVIERSGNHAIRITPEAGTVKTGKTRVVPLHEHLVAQGFLKFVRSHDDGPLFYQPAKKAAVTTSAVEVKKSRAAQVRQRLAAWVRGLGIRDKELRPNHAWRHTFKQIADSAGISERMSDSITGHAHKSEGSKYGEPTLELMAEAMKKFPQFELGGGTRA
jgi:integrase